MKTGKKIRIFCVIMVLTLFISCNRFVVSAEAETMLGDSVYATVTGNTLLVEGYGIIPDYPETGSSNPLYEYRDTIDTVIVVDRPVLFDHILCSQSVFYHYKRQAVSVAQVIQRILKPLGIDLPSPVGGFLTNILCLLSYQLN